MIKLKPRTRIILLSVISILIVVTIVLGITYSFMQANIESSSVTEVSLSSCAKITLSDTGASINLNNTNPISKNRALQTTPYTFTVTSSCESYVGFNLYLATLNTNTLVDSSVHYIITRNGSKDILAEGILSEATNALSEFTSDDQNQLNVGINGTFGTIYKLYNDDIPLQGEVSYDLYLYIDSEITDASTMGKTFNAGIAVKSYDREADPTTLADYIINEVYTGTDGENGLYYHDGVGSYTNADQEAGDNSYRFSGGDYKVTETANQAGLTRVYTTTNTESDGVVNFYCNGEKQFVGYSCYSTYEHYYTTAYNEETHHNTLEEALTQAVTDGYLTSDNIKNFVCFGPGASEVSCGADNLYRIIGVFDGQVKLIKYEYANSDLLGTNGDYSSSTYSNTNLSYYSGSKTTINSYYWNNITVANEWSESNLNTVNLNTNYWNYLTAEWQSKIASTTWQVGGNTLANIGDVSVKTAYTNEITSPAEATTYEDEIGLMYVTDYGYAASPENWSTALFDYDSDTNRNNNWMFMGLYEWTISRRSDGATVAFRVYSAGRVGNYGVGFNSGVRPSFYLESSVVLSGGSGTSTDPYRIA